MQQGSGESDEAQTNLGCLEFLAETWLYLRAGSSVKPGPDAFSSASTSAENQFYTRAPQESPSEGRLSSMRRQMGRMKSYVVQEHEIGMPHLRTLFFPTGRLKEYWDGLMLGLILYSCVSVPYRLGFGVDAIGWIWYYETGVTLLFLVDVCISFNTAYMSEDGQWVVYRPAIAGMYLRGWFWVDFPSSLPVELMELVGQYGDAEDDGTKYTHRLLRVMRLVRLVRLLKLLNLQKYVSMLEIKFRVSLSSLNLVQLFATVFYLTHLLGCGWYFVAKTRHVSGTCPDSCPEENWVDQTDPTLFEATTTTQYLYSFYWALTTLTTVG